MTPSEFKAWFDGFTEAFDGRLPTKAQWGRIKERVAEIDGKPVTERVYIDRYYHQYWSNPILPVYTTSSSWPGTCGTSTITCGGTSGVGYNGSATGASYNTALTGGVSAFDSGAAMAALGRAEATLLGKAAA